MKESHTEVSKLTFPQLEGRYEKSRLEKDSISRPRYDITIINNNNKNNKISLIPPSSQLI